VLESLYAAGEPVSAERIAGGLETHGVQASRF